MSRDVDNDEVSFCPQTFIVNMASAIEQAREQIEQNLQKIRQELLEIKQAFDEEKIHDLCQAVLPFLGKIHDDEIVAITGITIHDVRTLRRRQGVKAYKEERVLEEAVNQLMEKS